MIMRAVFGAHMIICDAQYIFCLCKPIARLCASPGAQLPDIIHVTFLQRCMFLCVHLLFTPVVEGRAAWVVSSRR